MFNLFRALFRLPFLETALRPITRFVVGALAIPLFRFVLRKGFHLHELDKELEKDLEQWFRAALLLLVASANMEDALFGWVPLELKGEDAWIGIALRLLLAVGVIEAMPDQDLFGLIHANPPRVDWKHPIRELREKWKPVLKGLVCKHLNRTSPVFVIMTAIFTGTVGWVCYSFSLAQYLIIGLVTSRDKALDVLSEFDKQVAVRREKIIREFDLDEAAEKQAAREARAEIAARTGPANGHGIADSAGETKVSAESRAES